MTPQVRPARAGMRRALLSLALVGWGVGVLVVVWGGLPGRYAPVDVAASALAAGGCVAGVGVGLGRSWARRMGLITMTLAAVLGMVLVTVSLVTASYLFGAYGPIGWGGGVLLLVGALLVVPYLVALPVALAYTLVRGAAAREP